MPRILVIDDEYDIRISLQKILEKIRLKVIIAKDFREGKQLLNKDNIDVTKIKPKEEKTFEVS